MSEMCSVLGLPPSYEELMNAKIRKGSRREDALFEAFGVTGNLSALSGPHYEKPTIREIAPTHGLFHISGKRS